MVILRSPEPLAWGALDLPLLGVNRDWHGAPFDPPAGFSLAVDPQRLWFIAGHARPAELHPDARPGRFQPDLWRHDVAELFLADPATGRYLELNLAPNGAWWSGSFSAARVADEDAPPEVAGVECHASLAPTGTWMAAMSVPVSELEQRIAFGENTAANVCLILGTPEQRFLSVADLGGGEPDFHRPDRFPKLHFHSIDELPDLPGGAAQS